MASLDCAQATESCHNGGPAFWTASTSPYRPLEDRCRGQLLRNSRGCGNVATDNQRLAETDHCDSTGCRHLEGQLLQSSSALTGAAAAPPIATAR